MNTILVQSIIGLLTFIAAVLSSVFIPINLNKKAKYASYIMDSRKNRIDETKKIILEYLEIFEQLEVASNDNTNKELYHKRCLALKKVQNRITLHFKPVDYDKRSYFKSNEIESDSIFKDGISSFNTDVQKLQKKAVSPESLKSDSELIDDVENLLSDLTFSITTYLSKNTNDEIDFNFEIIQEIIPLLASVLLKNEWELLKGEVKDKKILIEKTFITSLTTNLINLIDNFNNKLKKHEENLSNDEENLSNHDKNKPEYQIQKFIKDKNQTVPMFLESVLKKLDKEYEFPENIMSKNKNYYLSSDPNTDFFRKRKFVGEVKNKGKTFWFEVNASNADSERLARHISKGVYEYNN